MRTIIYSSLTFAMLFFFSCKKNQDDPKPDQQTAKRDAKSFLIDATSDDSSEYYIYAEYDGHKINCTSPYDSRTNYYDTGLNIISFVGPNDCTTLTRYNNDRTLNIALYFEQTRIFNRQFPYILPHPNLEQCEWAQIELTTFTDWETGQYTYNGIKFIGNTNANCKVEITRFENNIVEGTFQGPIVDYRRKVIAVKNGKFRLRVFIFHFDSILQ